MESEGNKTRGRRKRKAEGMTDQRSEILQTSTADCGIGNALVGSYVAKDPPSEARRALLGKIVSCDAGNGLLRVVYEDGHCDDLEHQEARKILLLDEGGSGMKLSCRKRKLDQLVPSAAASMGPPKSRLRKNAPEVPDGSELSSATRLASDLSEDADSSSDSCDFTRMPASDNSSLNIQIPPLPPSSGDIGVAEESVAYLFSVYNFLRSFSFQLFLSPFSLHNFVGALNCTFQNSLLDAVHVSLMRALKYHLETLSSEGSKLASKCLRQYDWTLLDSLTWPVFLVEYLLIMGYMREIGEEEFGMIVSENEYYALPVATKLKVLQILCDNIIDSAEIRTELEMRENMEEEIEFNVGACIPPESGPRRVHPRYSKTSAWKESEGTASSAALSKSNPASKVTQLDAGDVDPASDGNSDECQLCGMDGVLICCDGCPSAYHSRCIGLNKAFLPDGSWFCPECTINNLGPTDSRIGRGVRGAEVFGIDPYGQMFLGSCNYLLVIGTLLNTDSISRYYNPDDVTKVLSAICSKGESLSQYADICKGISEYWELSLLNTQTSGKTESIKNTQADEELVIGNVVPSIASVKNPANIFNNDVGENRANNITESSADNREILSQSDACNGTRVDPSALDLVYQATPDSQKYDVTCLDTSAMKTQEAAERTLFSPKNEQFVSGDGTKTAQKTLQQNKFNNQRGNGSVITSMSHLSQPISTEKSTTVDIVTCSSGNESGLCREDAGSSIFSKKDTISISNESMHGRCICSEKCRTISDKITNTPSFFKPQAYINQYILGDVAASAAANLAVLASEESKVSEAQVSSNPRKAAAANISLQMKAFSGAAMHFLWPSYEKKLMEVPRERCGWCFACKSASTNKRGCFLNLVAANAFKGSARSISGFRPIKHDESPLPVIAAHIANMEESLRGLVIGPFVDARYTHQWRKQTREASSCRILKYLLLELEKNIRGIAFSEDWMRMVDDWTVEFSGALTGMSRVGPNQKRRFGGRRNKKKSVAFELVQVSPSDCGNDVQWWRGGRLTKVVFQKGALPSSLVKKAARQGGCRRVPGITYPEGSELPRRNRQFAWRASVEMSKNASQLALQVRYLDAHIRWRDLVHPDQSSLEGKGSDIDASAFRNAVICDQKIAENKLLYALTFSNQKHLPLRVMKNILETESPQDENGKLWFSENHVPLYLIKEFEERNSAKPSPSSMTISSHPWIRSQRRKLKTCRREIFWYLLHKLENPGTCLCASCQGDVFLRDAVRCSSCQGYCHKDCTVPSTVGKEDDFEFLFTCNLCGRAKSAALIRSHKEATNRQLSSPGQNQQQTGIKCILKVGLNQTMQKVGVGLHATSDTFIKSHEALNDQLSSQGQGQQLASAKYIRQVGLHKAGQVVESVLHKTAQMVDSMEVHPGMRSSVSGSNSESKARPGLCHSNGLVWKRKKDNDDSGKNFRLENIVLKCKEGTDPSKRPTCCLCNMPYRSDLMYICCEKCPNWYHADAVNLEEAQIFDLKGFKCGKCRRKSSPKCPYLDPDYTKPLEEPPKQRNAETTAQRNGKSVSKLMKLENSSTLETHSKLEDLALVDENPFHPLEKFEPLEMEVQPNEPGSVFQGQQNPLILEQSATLVSRLETEDLAIVDDDPLLHCLGRVEPIERMVESEVQLGGPGAVSQGQQKLSIRRPQAKHGMSTDTFSATQDAYSMSMAFSGNLPNHSVSGNDAGIAEFSAIEEADFMGASDNAQTGWDCLDICGYADGDGDGDGGNSDIKDQLHDPGNVNFEDMEYEPQTYFSFTELLASEDGQLDDQQYDMSTDMSENWCHPAGLDDFRTIDQEQPCDASGAYEMESLDGCVAVTNEPPFDEAACEKCKINQPSPDLTCEICGLLIHSHCSPWIESGGPSGGAQWRCGSCRDWR